MKVRAVVTAATLMVVLAGCSDAGDTLPLPSGSAPTAEVSASATPAVTVEASESPAAEAEVLTGIEASYAAALADLEERGITQVRRVIFDVLVGETRVYWADGDALSKVAVSEDGSVSEVETVDASEYELDVTPDAGWAALVMDRMGDAVAASQTGAVHSMVKIREVTGGDGLSEMPDGLYVEFTSVSASEGDAWVEDDKCKMDMGGKVLLWPDTGKVEPFTLVVEGTYSMPAERCGTGTLVIAGG